MQRSNGLMRQEFHPPLGLQGSRLTFPAALCPVSSLAWQSTLLSLLLLPVREERARKGLHSVSLILKGRVPEGALVFCVDWNISHVVTSSIGKSG